MDSGPSDWEPVAVGTILSLRAPHGTSFQKQSPGDSFVGRLTGPGFDLQVDYGPYSDPLTDKSRFEGYTSEPFSVDGHKALLVFAKQSSTQFVGVHVPSLEATPVGPLSLTIAGRIAPGAKAAVVNLFSTIKFTRLR